MLLSLDLCEALAHPGHRVLMPKPKPRQLASVLERIGQTVEEHAHIRVEAAARPDQGAIPGLEIQIGPRTDLPIVVFGGADPEPAADVAAIEARLLQRAEQVAEAEPDPALILGLIRAWEGLGMVAVALDEEGEARRAYRTVLAHYDRLPPAILDSRQMSAERMVILEHWANLSFRGGVFLDAVLAYEELADRRIALAEHGWGEKPQWPIVAQTMIKLAAVRARLGELEGSRLALDAAHSVTTAMVANRKAGDPEYWALLKQLRYIEKRMDALYADASAGPGTGTGTGTGLGSGAGGRQQLALRGQE